MPEPELWVRYPSEKPGGEVERLLHLTLDDAGLVRVPFDKAVERGVAAWPQACSESVAADSEFVLDVPKLLERLLAAALGEDTPKGETI